MNKTETRLISGLVGGLLVVIAIIFENRLSTHERMVQISLWTLLVVAMAILGNYKYIRQRWFWQSLGVGFILHSVIVITFLRSMPFSSLGIVILFAFPEAILWQIIFIRFSAQ